MRINFVLFAMVIRKRLDLSGPRLVFITTAAKDHLPVFLDKAIAGVVIEQLNECIIELGVSMVGYVLMPTHLHMLLGFPKIELMPKLIQTFKSLSARKVKLLDPGILRNKLEERSGFSLWHPRYDDLVIFSEKQFKIKLDYIHNNPAKAGLVENPVEWKYSSLCDWIYDTDGLIPIDKAFRWTEH